MASKTKKTIVCFIILFLIAIIIAITIMEKKDNNILSLPTQESETTTAAIIDENIVGRWLTKNIVVDYDGATIFSILELQFNSDGSLIVYRTGYEFNVDKTVYVEKLSKHIIENYSSDEIEDMLSQNKCTSIYEFAEKDYEDYINNKEIKIEFMGYWQAKDGKLYNWGQGFTIEDSEAETYQIKGDKMLVGDVEYTKIVYTQGE